MQAALIFAIVFIVLIIFAVAIPAVIRSVGTEQGFFGGTEGQVLESTNRGIEWRTLGASFARGTILSLMAHPSRSQSLYLSIEGRGLFKSDDRGETWTQIIDGALHSDSTIYDMHFGKYRGADALYVAAFQNGLGSLLVSTNEKNFEQLYIAPLNNVALFTAMQHPGNLRLFVGTAQGGLLESVNNGESWRLVRWFPGPVLFAKANPRTGTLLVYTDQNRLFRSPDSGATWTEVSNELSELSQEGRQIITIAFHPTEAFSVYAGSDLGLLRSLDDGITWTLVRTTVPPEFLPVRSVAFDRNRAESLYIAVGSQLHVSVDRGATWQPIQVPTRRALVHLIVDQSNADHMYVATQ